MADVYTYNPKLVKISFGPHIVTGVADDSFVNLEPNGDGTTIKVGCYGEVNRAISANNAFTMKLALLQNSPTNKWLETRYKEDQDEGTGTFPVLVKDIMGDEKLSGDVAWVSKRAPWQRGKETTNREWEVIIADCKFTDA